MSRVVNFSAGPAAIPESVLQRAQAELLDWQSCGASVMEISHRSKDFVQLTEQIEQNLRTLLAIPSNYKVLFLQGGSTLQFAMIPANLLRGKSRAAYCNTGSWSRKALAEAKLYCDVDVVTDSAVNQFTAIEPQSNWNLNQEAAYLHYTANETIHGIEFQTIPDSAGLPLVADMSSNLLSRKFDVSQFGLIYACAQKNLGPAGITVVIVRDDLLGDVVPNTPSMLNYQLHAKQNSMLNTPPTWAWYVLGLILDWIAEQGGVSELEAANVNKSQALYEFIDSSGFYHNAIHSSCRSRMNVPFLLADQSMDSSFLQQAEAQGLSGLKGHREVGGMRASIYNAMTLQGVQQLIAFMREFEQKNA